MKVQINYKIHKEIFKLKDWSLYTIYFQLRMKKILQNYKNKKDNYI